MANITLRLDDRDELRLVEIQKETREATKSKAIKYAIKYHAHLSKRCLEQELKIRALDKELSNLKNTIKDFYRLVKVIEHLSS